MSSRYEMRFSGSGGQGMMVMGDVFASAAGKLEGKEVVLTKSYGPESRGGACRSDLIISADPIDYPVITMPHFLLAMTQLACNKYIVELRPDGVLLVDSHFVEKTSGHRGMLCALPLTEIARRATGRDITANSTAMGAAAVLGQGVSPDAVRRSLAERFKGEARVINELAFEAGAKAALALWGRGG